MGLRLLPPLSGGKQPNTSWHLTSTYGEGSEPKKTVTGSDLLKFSRETVSIFDAWGLGLARAARACGQLFFGASAARSGGKYLTTPGKGVIGFEGIGYDPVTDEIC